ncbi:hypothetical protein [Frankia sp. Cj3]|uniref:glycoside hydrolase family 113 n=1 Tax=Frankia sp. Cj3 TaxID=2880976 RepID=UPI001EF5DBF2|nr:hypothetical protein [Frankia sp. Cj3]
MTVAGKARSAGALLVILLGLAAVPGCASAPADRTPSFRPAGQERTAGNTGVPAAAPGPRISFPWRPGRPELGVQVYWDDNPDESAQMIALKAQRVTDYVVDLDANAISVSFPFFTDTVRSSTVHGARGTPAPERLGILLDEAARAGLRVTLRPTLDEKSLVAANPRDWRGTLNPVSRDAWFASYRGFLAPYLALAEQHHINAVVLGTELNSLEGDPRWEKLAAYTRTVFTGEIGYAFNWDVFTHTRARMPVDRVGVDAYPELPLGDTASVAELTTAWDSWLGQRAPGPMPQVMLYEVGAAAQAGIYRHPANPQIDGTPAVPELQQRWFIAACRVARARALAGLYWWRVDFHIDPAAVDSSRDRHESFIGRPAEQAIRDCFSAWGEGH